MPPASFQLNNTTVIFIVAVTTWRWPIISTCDEPQTFFFIVRQLQRTTKRFAFHHACCFILCRSNVWQHVTISNRIPVMSFDLQIHCNFLERELILWPCLKFFPTVIIELGKRSPSPLSITRRMMGIHLCGDELVLEDGGGWWMSEDWRRPPLSTR